MGETAAMPVRRGVGFSDLRWVAAIVLPLLLLSIGAWSRRWTSDDGFINLRIVQQIWAGNGPVWNRNERVEAGTSPLWLAVLSIVGGVIRFVDLEWIAVLLGIAGTVGGLAAGTAAARVLHRSSREAQLPIGASIIAAVPAFWDFASSGLETGLSFLWLGASAWALSLATIGDELSKRRHLLTAVLVGLGPLVRPDLALVSAPLLLLLLFVARRGGGTYWRRRALAVLGAATLLPILYQIFRMAFFAALVPNTAFAKEGSSSRWGLGWDYAGDLVGTWRLWWPGVVVVVVAAHASRDWWSRGEHDRLLVAGALTFAGLLHALYVIRVGGDFMHARLLLPALFVITLPWAVVPARRITAVAALVLAPWVVLAATTWEHPARPGQGGPAAGVVDERAYYVALSGHSNPVTADDFSAVPYAAAGDRAETIATEVTGVLSLNTFSPEDQAGWIPQAATNAPFLVAVDNVGVFGFLAGPDVVVVDLRGLGDPVTSRFRLSGPRGRPGHEKISGPEWVLGRYAAADAGSPPGFSLVPGDVQAARAALGCGDLAEVIEGITTPLTLSRALSNIALSFSSYSLRLSPDPNVAAAELC